MNPRRAGLADGVQVNFPMASVAGGVIQVFQQKQPDGRVGDGRPEPLLGILQPREGFEVQAGERIDNVGGN